MAKKKKIKQQEKVEEQEVVQKETIKQDVQESKSSNQNQKSKTSDDSKAKKEIVKAIFAKERIITEEGDVARELYNKSCYGKILDDKKVQLSLCEGLYLIEKGKIVVLDGRNKPIASDKYIKKAQKSEPNFWIRYCVFRDFRNRGYIIKTALKFGADFRVYDRGIKPGEDHAKWIVFPVHEGSTLTWHEFSAKNRVAHSTKKRLLIGVVDEEGDVTYWEVAWKRP
tara:strand:+ start:857 stop:1531 length:675 start_codon:yes stop_codon:yes gene_type:complete